MSIKAEVLQSILADANTAKPIPNMKHTYTPEEYNKIAAKQRAMGLINDGANGGIYEVHIDEGEVEFDANGNLKAFGRTRPLMLDLNRYCANRYTIQRVPNPPTAKAKGVKELGTYLVVVFGEAVVEAINSAAELPPTVRAYRFYRKEVNFKVETQEMLDDLAAEGRDVKGLDVGDSYTTYTWVYVRDEFIKREEVYQMTDKLNNDSALELIQLLEGRKADSATGSIEGTSLDDIS